MENLENTVMVENEEVKPETEFTNNEETVTEVDENIEDTSVPVDYVKKEEEEDEEQSSEEKKDESESDSEEKEDEDEKKKYTLIEEELETLKQSYSVLQDQYQKLLDFKNEFDNQKKEELIAEFYMLSDEDKADVISNKEKYTLDEIKSKLSVICFDKKINFSLNDEVKESKEEDIITYQLNDNQNSLPDWVRAVKEQEKLGY